MCTEAIVNAHTQYMHLQTLKGEKEVLRQAGPTPPANQLISCDQVPSFICFVSESNNNIFLFYRSKHFILEFEKAKENWSVYISLPELFLLFSCTMSTGLFEYFIWNRQWFISNIR